MPSQASSESDVFAGPTRRGPSLEQDIRRAIVAPMEGIPRWILFLWGQEGLHHNISSQPRRKKWGFIRRYLSFPQDSSFKMIALNIHQLVLLCYCSSSCSPFNTVRCSAVTSWNYHSSRKTNFEMFWTVTVWITVLVWARLLHLNEGYTHRNGLYSLVIASARYQSDESTACYNPVCLQCSVSELKSLSLLVTMK